MTVHHFGPESVLSIVAPCYNEAKGIEPFVNELVSQLEEMKYTDQYELILINDGSTDSSDRELDRMAENYPGKIKVIHLSRNFGHSPAVIAGLKHVRGDVIILMDSDMQDDPSCFPQYIQKWCEGYDVVYTKRASRREIAPLRFLFWLFYRILILMSDIHIPVDAGNFSLMDKRVVDYLLSLPEKNLYIPGLRAWVGFRQIGIQVPRRRRYDNSVKTRLTGKWKIALNAIFSFSFLPLIVFRIFGTLAVMVSIVLGSFVLYHKVVTGLAVTAWASNIITTTFFGGLNLLGIGIAGEYISRIFDEVRNRPLYIVDRITEKKEVSVNRSK